MTISSIAKMPTSVTLPIQEHFAGCTGIHESTLRCWHILERVKVYLAKDVPADVILELIAVMEEPRQAGRQALIDAERRRLADVIGWLKQVESHHTNREIMASIQTLEPMAMAEGA